MPRICYTPKKFNDERLSIIRQANRICAAYAQQGFTLTLRQLYYQFVARDLIPNRQSEYKRLGDIIAEARMAGLLDWDYLEDRTRNLEDLAHWASPGEILTQVGRQYRTERWDSQPGRCEVWVEKDALTGVIEPTCRALDVPYFSCRGYTSLSEIWVASQRIKAHLSAGQFVQILHLGDHDPSGIDMTRDIEDRLRHFITVDWLNQEMDWDADDGEPVPTEAEIWEDIAERCDYFEDEVLTINRLALNMNQVRQYNPPPNPAKLTDSRSGPYIARYGAQSWELDALEPTVLAALITEAVDDVRDDDRWADDTEAMDTDKAALALAATRWSAVRTFLEAEPRT